MVPLYFVKVCHDNDPLPPCDVHAEHALASILFLQGEECFKLAFAIELGPPEVPQDVQRENGARWEGPQIK